MSASYAWPVLVWGEDDPPRQHLAAPFSLTLDGLAIDIDSYTDFDGASIPRWLWASVGHPFMREFVRAALIHDYFYGEPAGRRAHGLSEDPVAARARADELFYLQLVRDGVPVPKAKRMRWAVERFGAERFNGPGYVARTLDQLLARERDDCNCARDEINAMLAEPPADHDPELLAGLAGLNWTTIRALLGSELTAQG